LPADIIDGAAVAAKVRADVARDAAALAARGIIPGLTVVLVGDDGASAVYVKAKEKACHEAGMHGETIRMPASTTQAELLAVVDGLNADPKIHGILVQMPLPKQIDPQAIIRRIAPHKDVDGFHPVNVGKVLIGDSDAFAPCTPWGALVLMQAYNVSTAGKEVLTHRQTISFTLAMTFLFAVMTTYLAGSEVIVEDIYGYGNWFPLIFGVVACLLAVNSLNNARIVKRIGITALLRRMSLIGLFTSAALVVVSFTGKEHPQFWVFYIAVACVVPVAQGLVPNCNAAAMMPVPHVAGTATAIIGTFSTAGAALLGSVATNAFNGTVKPFAFIIAMFIFIATAFIWWGSRGENEGLGSPT
jgi:hypothetical protein